MNEPTKVFVVTGQMGYGWWIVAVMKTLEAAKQLVQDAYSQHNMSDNITYSIHEKTIL